MKSSGKLSTSQAFQIGAAGIALGILPHLFGLLLGFAAFALTPIVGALFAVGVGILVRRIAPSAALAGLLLASCAAGVTFVGLFYATFALLAARNGAWLQVMGAAQASLTFVGATVAAALPIFLGVWLSRNAPGPSEKRAR